MPTGSPSAIPARITKSTDPSLYVSALTGAAYPYGMLSSVQPVTEALVVEQIVMSDDASFDSRHAGLAYLTCEIPKCAGLVAALADGGVAAADNRKITAHDAGIDWGSGHHDGLETVIPPQLLRSRCRRDDFYR